MVTRQQVTEAAGLRPGPGCKSPDLALAGQRDQHEGHPNVQTPEAENRAIPVGSARERLRQIVLAAIAADQAARGDRLRKPIRYQREPKFNINNGVILIVHCAQPFMKHPTIG